MEDLKTRVKEQILQDRTLGYLYFEEDEARLNINGRVVKRLRDYDIIKNAKIREELGDNNPLWPWHFYDEEKEMYYGFHLDPVYMIYDTFIRWEFCYLVLGGGDPISLKSCFSDLNFIKQLRDKGYVGAEEPHRRLWLKHKIGP